MSWFDWTSLFDEVHVQSGATEGEISLLVDDATRPLSLAEIEQTNAKLMGLAQSLKRADFGGAWDVVTKIDPSKWQMPRGALPVMYLGFLKWSNGGSFRTGEKWFDPMFRTNEVRGYLIGYDLPEWMPGVLPFAFDGGGTFYVFDMRRPPCDGEYPILVAHAGNLGFHGSRQIGSSFLEACRGKQSPLNLPY